MIPSQALGGIILFDGVCNLCNAFVNFVIARDPRACFRFAALQSDAGRRLLTEHGVDDLALRTVVLIEDARVSIESTAVLRILRRLDGPWPLTYGGIVVPPFVRDPVYRALARRRYRWFGRRDQCRLPEPGLEPRFLE